MSPFLRARLARRPLALVSLGALAALGTSCDGKDAPITAPEAAAAAVDVVASEADAVMLVRDPSDGLGRAATGGTSLQLSLVVVNPVGHELPRKRHSGWVSSDTTVLTVDSTGLATAVDTGTALAIALHKKVADTVVVRVVPVPAASVAMTPATQELFLGDTGSVVATALDSAGAALPHRMVTFAPGIPAVVSADSSVEAGDGRQAIVVARALGGGVLRATVANAPETGVPDATGEAAFTVRPQPVRTVVIEDEAPQMTVDDTLRLAARAYDRFGNLLADRAVAWSSLDMTRATVDALGLVTSRDPGTARIVATSEGAADTVEVRMTLPVEARALWVNRFEWTTEANIVTIFQRAALGNLNIVYFQVRGTGDAFYRSDLEPAAARLCGGVVGSCTPTWDPLAVAVREGKKYGIEVHAWLNAFTGWAASTTPSVCAGLVPSAPGQPQHMLFAHPEWIMQTSARVTMTCANSSAVEYVYVSPGIPAARTHLARVAADIMRRYDVAGIHLDRIRYPGQFYSSDPLTLAEFRKISGRAPLSSTTDSLWVQFRRNSVTLAVKEVQDSISAVRRGVVSAAVWPIYYNGTFGWPSSSGVTQYWQDPRAWAAAGALDVQVPMTYFNINAQYCSYTLNNPDWTCMLDDHLANFDGVSGRHTYIGIGANRDTAMTFREIRVARERGAKGISFYSYAEMASRDRFNLLRNGLFKRAATIPPMPWKGGPGPMFALNAQRALAKSAKAPKGRPLFTFTTPGFGAGDDFYEPEGVVPFKEFQEEPNVPPVLPPGID